MADASPIGKISQKCGDERKRYWFAAKNKELDVTVFITNDCQCDMRAFLKLVGEDSDWFIGIDPGQTQSTTVKGLKELWIECSEKGDHTDCKGTYQFWKT